MVADKYFFLRINFQNIFNSLRFDKQGILICSGGQENLKNNKRFPPPFIRNLNIAEYFSTAVRSGGDVTVTLHSFRWGKYNTMGI